MKRKDNNVNDIINKIYEKLVRFDEKNSTNVYEGMKAGFDKISIAIKEALAYKNYKKTENEEA